jgi:hypothetical protein
MHAGVSSLGAVSYQSEIALMNKLLSNRVEFIDEQLTQPPRMNHTGNRVPKDSSWRSPHQISPPTVPFIIHSTARIHGYRKAQFPPTRIAM